MEVILIAFEIFHHLVDLDQTLFPIRKVRINRHVCIQCDAYIKCDI